MGLEILKNINEFILAIVLRVFPEKNQIGAVPTSKHQSNAFSVHNAECTQTTDGVLV